MNTAAMELRSAYPQTMSTALGASGLIHLAILGAIVVMMNGGDNALPIIRFDKPIHIREIVVPLTPSTVFHPVVEGMHTISTDKGHYIPIPETSLDPDIEVKNTISTGTGTGVDDGTGSPDGGIGGEGGVSEGNGNGTADEVFESFTAGIEKLPVPVSAPAPQYPDIARRAGLEGSVYVKVLVGSDGRVRSAEVVKSTNELFNDAALESAQRWTFTPALMANRTVSVWMTLPFRFRLSSR